MAVALVVSLLSVAGLLAIGLLVVALLAVTLLSVAGLLAVTLVVALLAVTLLVVSLVVTGLLTVLVVALLAVTLVALLSRSLAVLVVRGIGAPALVVSGILSHLGGSLVGGVGRWGNRGRASGRWAGDRCTVRLFRTCCHRAGPRVRVDRAACAEDPRVQGRRLLELYDDLAVGLPPVVLDEVFQMLRESLAVQLVFRSDVLMIGGTEQQRVAVGRKDRTVTEVLERLLGFSL